MINTFQQKEVQIYTKSMYFSVLYFSYIVNILHVYSKPISIYEPVIYKIFIPI